MSVVDASTTDGKQGPAPAATENLSHEAQLLLAQDKDWFERVLTARQVTDPEAQLLLARDEYEEVRTAAAQNPGLVLEAQLLLAGDVDQNVRYTLAENLSITPEAQLLLVHDKNFSVRYTLAENPSIALETQLLMMSDPDRGTLLRLGGNQSVILTAGLPLRFLEVSARCAHFVRGHLASAGLDGDDVSALRSNWTGTLSELVETAKELASEPA